jgi:hypothetical protein
MILWPIGACDGGGAYELEEEEGRSIGVYPEGGP